MKGTGLMELVILIVLMVTSIPSLMMLTKVTNSDYGYMYIKEKSEGGSGESSYAAATVDSAYYLSVASYGKGAANPILDISVANGHLKEGNGKSTSTHKLPKAYVWQTSKQLTRDEIILSYIIADECTPPDCSTVYLYKNPYTYNQKDLSKQLYNYMTVVGNKLSSDVYQLRWTGKNWQYYPTSKPLVVNSAK